MHFLKEVLVFAQKDSGKFFQILQPNLENEWLSCVSFEHFISNLPVEADLVLYECTESTRSKLLIIGSGEHFGY